MVGSPQRLNEDEGLCLALLCQVLYVSRALCHLGGGIAVLTIKHADVSLLSTGGHEQGLIVACNTLSYLAGHPLRAATLLMTMPMARKQRYKHRHLLGRSSVRLKFTLAETLMLTAWRIWEMPCA